MRRQGIRSLTCEQLEARRVLTADVLSVPADTPMDVNQDGFVAPVDALHVINRLGSQDAQTDVDGNGHVAPLDAMLVMNLMTRLGNQGGGNNNGNGPMSIIMDDHVNEIGEDATPLNRGFGSGRLEMAGDVDVFQFTPEEAVSVEIGGRDFVEGGVTRTILDADGIAVTANDDGAFELAAGSTYYVSVEAVDSEATGFYLFVVRPTRDGGGGGGDRDDHVNEVGEDATNVRLRRGRGSATGRLESEGDVDVFQFTLDADTTVALSSETRIEAGVSVELLDGDGNVIGLDDAGSAELSGGTYFIAVAAADGVSTGSYLVQIRADQGPPPDDHVNEPGADASEINIRRNRGFGAGEIETAGDIDVFQFALEADATVRFRSETRMDGGVGLTVIDGNGDTVSLDDGAANLSAGTYFIAVAATDAADTGRYAVSLRVDSGPRLDDHVNEVGEDATEIRLRGRRDVALGFGRGVIGEAGDVDVFQFTLEGAATVNLRTRSDVTLQLSDGTNIIEIGEDGAELEAGTYFVIAAAEGDATGRYTFLVRAANSGDNGGDESGTPSSRVAMSFSNDAGDRS